MNGRHKAVLTMVACMGLVSGCSTSQPFVGDRSNVYTPIEGYNYEYTAISTFSVNDGCGPNVSGVDLHKVGKSRFGGGSQCGGFLLPKKWTPGQTVTVKWKLDPHPGWYPRRLPGGGVMFNPQDEALKEASYEYHQAVVPVPEYGEGKPMCALTVHFLACNQVFVDSGCKYTWTPEAVKADFDRFRASQKLCQPRPVIKTIQDYHRVFGK